MKNKLLTGITDGFTKGIHFPGWVLHRLGAYRYSLAWYVDQSCTEERDSDTRKSVSYQVGSGIGDACGALLCLAFPPSLLVNVLTEVAFSYYQWNPERRFQEVVHQSLLAHLESHPQEAYAQGLEKSLASYEHQELRAGREPKEVRAYIDALRVHLTLYQEEIRDEAFRAARMGRTTLDGAVRALETIKGLKGRVETESSK